MLGLAPKQGSCTSPVYNPLQRGSQIYSLATANAHQPTQPNTSQRLPPILWHILLSCLNMTIPRSQVSFYLTFHPNKCQGHESNWAWAYNNFIFYLSHSLHNYGYPLHYPHILGHRRNNYTHQQALTQASSKYLGQKDMSRIPNGACSLPIYSKIQILHSSNHKVK